LKKEKYSPGRDIENITRGLFSEAENQSSLCTQLAKEKKKHHILICVEYLLSLIGGSIFKASIFAV